MKTPVVERAGDGLVQVTLNRARKKNALDAATWNEPLDVFREVSASGADRVLVLTGARDAFCSGASWPPARRSRSR